MFTKSPVGSIVESVGSVINRHGNKLRGSLTTSNLSNEVSVAWNGTEEFTADGQNIIKTALHTYFPKRVHFYKYGSKASTLLFTSTSKVVMNQINRQSRIS